VSFEETKAEAEGEEQPEAAKIPIEKMTNKLFERAKTFEEIVEMNRLLKT